MNYNYEICVIGTEALLFPFLQFGFITYTPPSEAALRDYLQEAIDKNYGIIYIEDSYCFMVKDILDKYRDSLTPVFIPIGESEDGKSFSRLAVKEMMEKAIGMNII
jgi:vacuolar-type H+-ATPase subunit F/Vma7